MANSSSGSKNTKNTKPRVTRTFIVKKGRGAWSVKSAGTERPTAVGLTKEEAYAKAKQIVENKGGGEVTILRDGKIVASHTIPAKSKK